MPETGLTPPRLAARWHVKPDKVLTWINAGELAAINIATKARGRPRWVVLPEAVAAFEARRSNITPAPTRTRRHGPRDRSALIEFF